MRAISKSTVVVATLACASLFAPSASAQGTNAVAGSRVRVSGAGLERLTGTIVSLAADTLVLRTSSGQTVATPLTAGTRVDVSTGLHRHPWKGAGYGMLGGAALGAAIGAVAFHESQCDPTNTYCLNSGRQESAGEGAIILSTLGVFIGAAAGSIMRTEGWRRVSLAESHLGLATPTSHGRAELGLALSY
jgi:hypothetical protein